MSDVQTVKSGKVVAPTKFDKFRDNLQARAREVSRDKARGSEIVRGQAEKILAAQTVDEIMAADEGGTVSGLDFVDVPFQALGYELGESNDDFSSDLDVYANLRAVVIESSGDYSPGDEIIVNVGGTLVVTKLEALRAADAFPINLVIKKYGRVLKLRLAGERAIPGTTA